MPTIARVVRNYIDVNTEELMARNDALRREILIRDSVREMIRSVRLERQLESLDERLGLGLRENNDRMPYHRMVEDYGRSMYDSAISRIREEAEARLTESEFGWGDIHAITEITSDVDLQEWASATESIRRAILEELDRIVEVQDDLISRIEFRPKRTREPEAVEPEAVEPEANEPEAKRAKFD